MHIAILHLDEKLLNRRLLQVTGSPVKEGLPFDFFWLPDDKSLVGILNPLFAETEAEPPLRNCP